ncbi:MAG: YheC/YheD family protein [Sulfuricellaceae bacterium]|nr:YheC/YheD family protein [Sulfuricellaceae bacterium]
MSLRTIGFLCDARLVRHPFSNHHAATLDRVVPMSDTLKELGVELFLFSPHHVDARHAEASGFVLENGDFIQATRSVPRINGNWYFNLYPKEKNPANMSMAEFIKWGQSRDINVYPSLDFSILVNDKYASYQAISRLIPNVQPYSEIFNFSIAQLEHFLSIHTRVFLKPRYGGHGDGIVVLDRAAKELCARFYLSGMRWLATTTSLTTFILSMKKLTGTAQYIIQTGIDTETYDDRVFDVRVMLVNNGHNWIYFPFIRLGGASNDVSNIGQGGTAEEAVQILEKLYSRPIAEAILANIKHFSMQIASHLSQQFPPGISELALDIVLDKDQRPWLIEINIQPAMGFPGVVRKDAYYLTYQDIFHPNEEEMPVYEKYTKPYGQCLAQYFYSQLNETSRPVKQE